MMKNNYKWNVGDLGIIIIYNGILMLNEIKKKKKIIEIHMKIHANVMIYLFYSLEIKTSYIVKILTPNK